MERDIDLIYEEYVACIEILKDNPEDKAAKAEVVALFAELFDLIKMFLILKKERYYGYFLINMDVRFDCRFGYPAGVNTDTNPFTMKINPIQMSSYSIKEMIFIICHEIEHLVLNHPAEGVRFNKEKDIKKHAALNIAMDASVNDRLVMEIEKYDIGMMKCPDDAITSEFLGMLYQMKVSPLREFTYYYHLIPPASIKVIKVKRIDSHDWTENDAPDDVEAAIKLFVENAARGISDEDRGKLPAHQRETIERILAPPKIKWQNVLKKYVGTLPDVYRNTKTRLNRRQPLRYDISGQVRSRTVKLVVAVDTSGSMSKRDLEDVFIEIFGILKHVNHEITVIECDADVQNVYRAEKLTDVNLDIKGRGGTAFTPVIEHINDNGHFKDALLVYFTDGFGECEIPKPRTYRNLWITTTGHISLNETYGEVVEL